MKTFLSPALERPILRIGAVVLAGALISIGLWLRERREIRRDAEQRLQEAGLHVCEMLRTRIARAEQILLGFRGLHTVNGHLNQQDWTTYIRSLEPRQVEGLASFTYTRRIARADANRFLEETRRDQGPAFHLTSLTDYPDMMVIVHQWVFQGNPVPLGRDRSDAPEWILHGEYARRTGKSALTAPLSSIGEPGLPRVILMLPIYQAATPPQTEEERKSTHSAWISAGLYLKDLFDHLDPLVGQQIRLDAFEEKLGEASPLPLFHQRSALPLPSDTIEWRGQASLADRRWQIRLSAQAASFVPERTFLANQLLAGGLFATGLLGLLVWTAARTERRAIRIADTMTRDLKEREWTLREAQRIANVGLCIYDRPTNTMIRSEEYLRLLGLMPSGSSTEAQEFLDVVHPEDRDRFSDYIRKFTRGEVAAPETFRVVVKDRGERILFLHYDVLRRDSAGPVRVMAILQDITDRIAADRALAESHAQLDQLMKVMPGAIFQLQRSKEGVLSLPFISEGATALFGLPAASLLTDCKQLVSLLDAAEATQFHDSLCESARLLQLWSHEALFHLPFGGKRWARFSAIPEARSGEGKTIWRGVVIDITSEKQAEQTLRENEQRLRFTQFAVDHVRDAVAFVNPEGNRIYVNEETCRLTGYTQDELLRNKIWTTFTSFTQDAYCQLWALVKKHGTHVFEAKLRTKVGASIPVEVSATFIEFGEREIVFAIARDVSSRKAAEQALRASEERLRLTQFALDHAQDIVSIIDVDGNRLYVNETFCHYTGCSREEVFSTKIWTEIPLLNAERFHSLWEDIRRSGTLTIELEILTKKGEKKPVEINASHINFGGREAICTIARDLSARKAAEIEKKRMEQQLRETQKLESLGVLAGGIAHDFNNLLTGILGNASLARDRLPEESDMHEPLRQIERASTRAAELCQQMLAYAGKGRFIVEPVSLSVLVEDTAKLIDLSIARRATLELKLFENLPPVLADATQMRQIVMNLVINAAEAITHSHGHIVVSTGCMQVTRAFLDHARVASLPEGEAVYLEVRDNGSGMDRVTLDRIFEPFFTTKFTGRGLGLAAVLGIVRAHEGALHVQSDVGHGTTFRLALAPHSLVAKASPALVGNHKSSRRNTGRILVVDDEESVRSVTRQALERTGFVVETAEDGETALEKLKTDPKRFHLIILDFTMPRLDGGQTLREIRRLNPEARVILMSGFSENETRERLGGEALSGFVQKPFDLAALRHQVEQVVNQSRNGS